MPPPSRALVPLLVAARHMLGVSQGSLGEMLGSSRRSGQRWESAGSFPSEEQLHRLAGLVFPQDPGLAERIAAAGQSSLLALGIVEPPAPPAPPPPPPPRPPVEDVVDAVVCAAAEAIDVTPRAIRPALLAAFARARRLGLHVEEVESALASTSASMSGRVQTEDRGVLPPEAAEGESGPEPPSPDSDPRRGRGGRVRNPSV